MLTHINILDFTIIEKLELELQGGMTALTGETGAGKSILVDALALALGGRADAGVIRHGCERAEITAEFNLGGIPAVQSWLAEQELDDGDTCLVRRIINRDGRSRGFINGRPVPMQTLQQLGDHLVDIHGQHEHHSLLRREVQRELLDDFAGCGALTASLADCFRKWKSAAEQLEELHRAATDRSQRIDLLSHQAGELEALAPRAEEFATLEEEYARLSNVSELLATGQRVLYSIYEDEHSIVSALHQSIGAIEKLRDYDAHLATTATLLQEADVQLKEAAGELRRYLDNLELDPARLQTVEARMTALHDMARKHRVSPDELPAMLLDMQTQLAALEETDVRLDRLQTELKEAAANYERTAAKLSAKRAAAAKKMAAQISANMQELGMPGGNFTIVLEPRPAGAYSPAGMEQVEFQVSANAGQPVKPLSKVASGGELSRISLALQVIIARGMGVPVLVFDEVDVGIGGRVAEIVGKQLRKLGEARQVLCVTHLPQVAALAHHHLLVTKQTARGTTRTQIHPLKSTDRHEEIARMLGGVEITAQTRAHAREMVARAQE